MAPTTGPGLVKHITDISYLPLTSGMVYSGWYTSPFVQQCTQQSPLIARNSLELALLH
jgi:hypothetical protein